MQGLTLHGGPCRAVFDVQATYVDNLRRFVVTFFGKEYEGRKRPQLEFFRPVFTKVQFSRLSCSKALNEIVLLGRKPGRAEAHD